jgi:Na+/proline symporter
MSGVNVRGVLLDPLVVAVYVIAGGLRSTFIADYTHTVILFVAIFIFGFNVYKGDGPLGWLDGFYDLLVSPGAQSAMITPSAGDRTSPASLARATP